MFDLAERCPALVLLAFIAILLIYGCSGGVKAFCQWRNIDLHGRRVQYWIVSMGLVFAVLALTTMSVFSGLFIAFLSYVGLFALAYFVVRLIIGIASTAKGQQP